MADTAVLGSRNRSAGRRSARRPAATEETRRRALTAILVLLPAVALSLLLVLPAARITRLEITGSTTLEREEVLRWAALHGTEHLATVDPDRIAANLESHPRVAQAEVRRLFPNGLEISITDRVAVAVVLTTVAVRLVPVGVDRDGVVFRILPAD
ncbi:MAG TPA: FtsQ-type POTRA domain-containing protein, partial [Magnetospirillaceae bacterium]|nr:FtsQ-type POTRA domain-containing protein [Magnetospirillaceae bacterium]